MTRLSVVMPVLNGERHLRDALDSILTQTVADFELIVVDDASSDSTPDILDEYRRRDPRVAVLRNPSTLGPYPSANRALEQAHGEIVARHDADDISPADRFAIQLDALDAESDVSLVAGAAELFDDESDRATIVRPPASQPLLEWEMLFGNPIGAGGVMFRRVVAGGPVRFGTMRRYAEDFALWRRLSGVGRVVTPDAVVYRYRRHPLSISERRRSDQQACVTAICHQHQSEYLPPRAEDESANLTRFWSCDGDEPLALPFAVVTSHLAELRGGFLRYVERRYGEQARLQLDRQIRDSSSARFGYWLYRSLTWRDHKSCRELLSSGRALDAMRVGGAAAGYGARAIGRRFRPEGARPSRRR